MDIIEIDRQWPSRSCAIPARAPEPRSRKLLIRTAAVVALLVGAIYLVWRATSTLNPDAWVLSVLLLVLEAHAWTGLALFTFALWDVDGAPVPPGEIPDLRIAVLIPTYNESLEVLLPTISAAVALEPEHETWVLDDGNRDDVEEMATHLGARYLTRPEHTDAKAGNLNHALSVIDVDLVAVLDADHVATPGFLLRTMPYFHDDEVALVQTPQDFYNESSFEHVHAGNDESNRVVFSEQAVFYRELQPAKNRWGGAFWCGTGAVIRVAALRSVGGVTTTSITEDIQTTIRMHREGWRSVYHDEVLARGLAADTAEQYALQRRRWCTGAMQVLRQEHPLADRRLTLAQRLTYASTLLGWFDAIRLLALLVLPLLVLATGSSPIAAPMLTFGLVFGVTLLLQQHALWRLGRGRIRPIPTAVFDLSRLEATLQAIFVGLTGKDVPFQVTPKGSSGESSRPRVRVPRLLGALALGHVTALVWYAMTIAGLTPMTYDVLGVAHGAAFWAVVNGGLIATAIHRIRSQDYAGDRRGSYRHSVSVAGRLADDVATVTDLSLTGAQLQMGGDAAPPVGWTGSLDIDMAGDPATFLVKVRAVEPLTDEPTHSVVGVEFADGQLTEQARLALGLFHASGRGIRSTPSKSDTTDSDVPMAA